MNNRRILCAGALAILTTIALLGALNLLLKEEVRPLSSLSIEDLPEGVQYVRHPGEEEQALEEGKTVMQHYGTPETVRNGGPIYGVLGYRVVSLEYEIPTDSIPSKTVGQSFPGYLLDLPELKNLRYDHFHISRQEEGLAHAEGEVSRGDTYAIHFMFIPHEEELRFGLVCE